MIGKILSVYDIHKKLQSGPFNAQVLTSQQGVSTGERHPYLSTVMKRLICCSINVGEADEERSVPVEGRED